MADSSITFSTQLDNAQLEKDLAKATKKIDALEKKLAETQQKRGSTKDRSLFGAAELDAEKAKLEQMKANLQEIRDIAKDTTLSHDVRAEAKTQIPVAQAEIAEQQQRVNALQSEWNKVTGSVERYDSQIKEITGELDRQKTEAGALTEQLDAARATSGRMGQAVDQAGAFLDRFTGRIKKLAARVFVFTLITTALRSMRTWLSKAIKTNGEATAAIARLKGALLTLAQPLVEVIIPAFTTLVNVLTAVVGSIASFMSALFGTTVDQSAAAAKGLYEEQEALDGIGSSAKKAGKSMAAFDEINQLSGGSDTSGGGADTAEIAPDFSWGDFLSDKLKEIADLITLIGLGFALWKIGESLPGALGTISSLLGSILLIIGGLVLAWNGLTDAWENGVDWANLIEMVGGLAAAAFGLYTVLSVIAPSLANVLTAALLVVGGIVMLVTAFSDAMENGWNLRNTLLAIAGLVATGLGFFFLTGSVFPLVIAGIAGLLLAITVATGHGKELLDGIRTMLEGFIDFFTGVFTGDFDKAMDGLTKIAEGFGEAFWAVVYGIRDVFIAFLDWLDEKTGGKFHNIFEAAKDFVYAAFAAMQTTVETVTSGISDVLSGLIEFISGVFSGDLELALSGISKLFGGLQTVVGAVIGGAKKLIFEFLDFLDNATGGRLTGIINFVKGLFSSAFDFISSVMFGLLQTVQDILTGIILFIVGVFTGDWKSAWDGISGVFKGVWNGMVSMLEAAVNLIVDGINGLIRMLNKVSFDVPDWVPAIGGSKFGFNVSTISRVSIPRLAQGAVIPPNREFMAVLGDQKRGTNIEAPAQLIKQMVMEALREMGVTGGGSNQGEAVMVVDGEVFGRLAYRLGNRESKRMGVCLVEG